MKKPVFPTVEEMQKVKSEIEKKLSVKKINTFKNAGIKEGYTDCLRILNERIENPNNPYFSPETDTEVETSNQIYREQLKGIDKLKTQQGRGIAILCVDFLNGKIPAKTLLDIPIVKR